MKAPRTLDRVLVTIILLIGLSLAMPGGADAHSMGAGIQSDHAGKHQSATSTIAATIDCPSDFAVGTHGACCGTFGCSAPCLLAPPAPAAATPSYKPIFAWALAETAAGIPPRELKRPPRFAR